MTSQRDIQFGPAVPAKLRNDLITKIQKESTKVHDPITQYTEEFENDQWAVVTKMDGIRTLQEICQQLPNTQFTPTLLSKISKWLEANLLIETPWVREELKTRSEFEQTLKNDRGASLPVYFLSDSSWKCSGCGQCCYFGEIGPIKSTVVRPIQKAINQGTFSRFDTPPFIQKGEKREWFINHLKGHCSFLGQNGLCEVHSLMSLEAKPRTCRTFPYQVMLSCTGADISIRQECYNLWNPRNTDDRTSHNHKPTDFRTSSVQYLLKDATNHPPIDRAVDILEGEIVSYKAYREIEDIFLKIAEMPRFSFGEKLVCMGQLIEVLFKILYDSPCNVYPMVPQWATRIREHTMEKKGNWHWKKKQVLKCLAFIASALRTQLENSENNNNELIQVMDQLHKLKDLPEETQFPDFEIFQLRQLIFGKELLRAESLAAGLGRLIFFLAIRDVFAQRERHMDPEKQLNLTGFNRATVNAYSFLRSREYHKFFDKNQKLLEILCVASTQ